jgi:hypothetical protein
MERKLYTLAFLLAIVFFFTQSKISWAQGTFSCRYRSNPNTYSPVDGECVLDKGKYRCIEGYVPEFDCSLYNHSKEKCEGIYNCVKENDQKTRCISKNSVLQCTDPKYPVSCNINFCCMTEEDCENGPQNLAASRCNNDTGINTALGCIPVNDLNEFVGWLLRNLTFIATGIAFFLMVFGAIQILTSSGNPDKVKVGGELITSAISGLLFIILSVFLLKLIGVDILQIPGFGQ